jgi:hypothetical protein
MARDKNTYAKHQRETLKRQKVEAKQERRRKRKATGPVTEGASSDGSMPWGDGDVESPLRELATVPDERSGTT